MNNNALCSFQKQHGEFNKTVAATTDLYIDTGTAELFATEASPL